MSYARVAFSPRRGVAWVTRAQAGMLTAHSVDARVKVAWGLLFCNTLTYFSYPHVSLVHLPGSVGKGVAQSMLPAALLVILTINRKLIVRPNVFLCLVSLLVIDATLNAIAPQTLGSLFRTVRMAGFVAALWLLTPWWGRRDLLLVRGYLTWLWWVLGSVLVGLMISPHKARDEGRLTGIVWTIPPTQVAHYAAIGTGMVVVLWFCGYLPGRTALIGFVVGTAMLIETHTRTALAAMVASILVAGLSLIVAKARVRKFFAITGAIIAVAIMGFGAVIAAWLARGQSTAGISQLTGRTQVWGPLLAYPRDRFQVIFGFGLSNASFKGNPIDGNWPSSYWQLGLFGVIVCAIILVYLLVTAYFQPRGVGRALALFFITYCLVASFTEDGFTDVSPYLLDITLAASLLVPPLESNYLM